jgi:hypothetical protein
VVAVDAGSMQIQWWEGAVLSGAETVLQGMTHDTVRVEIGYGEKVSQRLWSKKVEEGIGLTARQRCGVPGNTQSFRVGESGFMPLL